MKNPKWTEKEIELLFDYSFQDDSETIAERIQHAHYMMYLEGNHPELKERTISACINKFYQITSAKQLETQD